MGLGNNSAVESIDFCYDQPGIDHSNDDYFHHFSNKIYPLRLGIGGQLGGALV
jgi:hypothetical protein